MAHAYAKIRSGFNFVRGEVSNSLLKDIELIIDSLYPGRKHQIELSFHHVAVSACIWIRPIPSTSHTQLWAPELQDKEKQVLRLHLR